MLPLTTSIARRRAIALVASVVAALSLFACDAAEDIIEPPPPRSGAQLTIWTSDPAPSPISVAVNGQTLGTLTFFRSTAPRCGDFIPGEAITIDVTPGRHVISAFETQSTGTWGPSTVSLSAGQCLTYELRP